MAANLKSTDLKQEEEDILNSDDDFEVCSSHLTESDIGSHSDEGHPQEESKLGEHARSQKIIGKS